jgi:hypothetical protein
MLEIARCLRHPCSLPTCQRLMTLLYTSKYVGKVLRVQPGSLMVTAVSPQAARLNAIAMRWSSYVSMATPLFRPPAGGVMTQ